MEENIEDKRVPCEIYSRITGYIRPVDAWNPSKQQEFADRKMYNVDEIINQ
jgi:ribonucleoside-triphosphate reductase